ncbi:MAG: pseudouridine synthase [Bacteroidales bacterium]|nr:pseudouridine synthase [Bacteroidales bacterium]
MENYENGGYDHEQTENRREYGDRPVKPEEGARHSYSESSDRPRRPYNREDGNRPRGSFQPHRSYNQNGDEGYGRPRQGGYGNAPQRRSYNNQNGDDGYNRPRGNYGNNGQRRSYNQNGEDGGYGRSRGGNGYGNGSQRRSYNNQGDEGYGRPRTGGYGNNNRRSYNNGDDGNYGRPRGNQGGQRRYNNQGGEGYNRPRKQQYAEDGYNKAGRYAEGGFNPEKKAGTKLRPRKNKTQQPKPETGIERMIKRNPQLNDRVLSDNDLVHVPVKEVVRLNKFIADSGICSRREADNFIVAGVVTVNGQVVSELGSKVNIFNDDVRFNGERLRGEPKVYIVMNKPKGFVTTASDPHAEKTVMDLLKNCNARVFPVGRLDKNTTGVLMFTNDGEIAEKLTHPSYDKKKIYQVTLTSELSQEHYDQILAGVSLSDGLIAADALEYVDDNDRKKLGIEIHSGKNRIVRRIFESLGYTVKGLDRVYFAGLTKKGIKRGGWRYLTENEVNILKMGAYN